MEGLLNFWRCLPAEVADPRGERYAGEKTEEVTASGLLLAKSVRVRICSQIHETFNLPLPFQPLQEPCRFFASWLVGLPRPSAQVPHPRRPRRPLPPPRLPLWPLYLHFQSCLACHWVRLPPPLPPPVPHHHPPPLLLLPPLPPLPPLLPRLQKHQDQYPRTLLPLLPHQKGEPIISSQQPIPWYLSPPQLPPWQSHNNQLHGSKITSSSSSGSPRLRDIPINEIVVGVNNQLKGEGGGG
ncbi:hypothetical protein V1517DRAFT_322244 [Lipomyces orientalis]|uniref:Uncharacterized protein n=1 Tax=Lipomyces orientalis TaxID=1233043 RepID=A0ACC3TPY5_9ASCO